MTLTKFAVLGAALAMFAAANARAERPDINQDDARAALRQNQISPSSQREIESTLDSVLKNAIDGDFDDVADNLTSADRDRVKSASNNNNQMENLKPAAEQLKNNWKARYSKDISPSTIGYIVAAGSDAKNAMVKLPERAGVTPVTLRLVDEGSMTSKWRIDLPDSVTGQQLHDNLVNSITRLSTDKASWPADPAEAYQVVAQRVFSALAQQ